MAKMPPVWGKRPTCNTPADLLAWLDRQAEIHRSVLQADRCVVDRGGTNTDIPDVTVTDSQGDVVAHQGVFLNDIHRAHDWIRLNPIDGCPPRPADLVEADGRPATTDRLVMEYEALRRALVSSSAGPWSPPESPREEQTEEGAEVRNRWFLKQYETKGTDTYRSPKRIHDLWNALGTEERAKIASKAPTIISYEAVVQGIQRARKLRDGTVKKRKSSRPQR